MHLFAHTIKDWSSWSSVFHSRRAFEALIRHIYEKEKLPYEPVEDLTPGTNAVFKVGNTIAKIFAPKESGLDTQTDYDTEVFGLTRANALGISAPKILARGCVFDRYQFLYLILEYIDGTELSKVANHFSDIEKKEIGRKLRAITEKLNTSCKCPVNQVNVIHRALTEKKWNTFPPAFTAQRLAWLKEFQVDEQVYVHGDLHPDNILIDQNKQLFLIDFADGVSAPAAYELAPIVCETFGFEHSYLKGYFGESYDCVAIAEACVQSLLMHDFGDGILTKAFGNPAAFTDLNGLKKRIMTALEQGTV